MRRTMEQEGKMGVFLILVTIIVITIGLTGTLFLRAQSFADDSCVENGDHRQYPIIDLDDRPEMELVRI